MNSNSKKIYINIAIQISVFAVLVFLDQLTKSLAFTNLRFNDDIPLIDNFLSLHYTENTGAAFGIFKNSKWFFIILSLIVIIAVIIIYIVILKKMINNSAQIKNLLFPQYILSVLTAGAVGNLIDRIKSGFVVDFIKTDFMAFPIFNCADIYVTCSVAALIIYIIFFYKSK